MSRRSHLTRHRRVFVLEKLSEEQVQKILRQALRRLEPQASNTPASTHISSSPPPSPIDPAQRTSPDNSQPGLSEPNEPAHPQATPKILTSIASLAAGDARTALSLLELVLSAPSSVGEDKLLESLKRSVSSRWGSLSPDLGYPNFVFIVNRYDRSGEDRYDMISALHKSLRGSDGSAAMYWLARFVLFDTLHAYILCY